MFNKKVKKIICGCAIALALVGAAGQITLMRAEEPPINIRVMMTLNW